ncbi:MAG: menaquinone biosynthesis protein [Firmicutes bacterium]|nr:menaquinone biosynthesis protein [Bacillota bacterium]
MEKVRLGRIDYINVLPIYFLIERNSGDKNLELVKENPRALNELLFSGRLDISPISSIEYARHQNDYFLVNDLALSALGAVRSVLLFSQEPLEKLLEKKVAVTSSSATSGALLRIIFNLRFGRDIHLTRGISSTERVMKEYPAALLIGDEALRVKMSNGLKCYDLGELWHKMTGEKMVYALWAVRRRSYAKIKERIEKVVEDLRNSRDYGIIHPELIAKEANRITGFPVDFLKKYFTSLEFNLDDKTKKGLITFYKYASDLGISPPCRELKFIQ